MAARAKHIAFGEVTFLGMRMAGAPDQELVLNFFETTVQFCFKIVNKLNFRVAP